MPEFNIEHLPDKIKKSEERQIKIESERGINDQF